MRSNSALRPLEGFMRFGKNLFLVALIAVSVMAAAPANAQKMTKSKLFGAHGRIPNLTETAGACPGFTCDSDANCTCFQAFGRLMVKPFGVSDIDLMLNLNMAPAVSTGVGGHVFSGEGE